ncbi:hypothetical protein SAMN02745121_05418 [Nannocystis exedens]|uniref:Secreted protein n=1 Tax=Nannocystis exedens TaxID=54 RepID=A0A1I2D6P1_9BACT|nr:hypothetical protein [Nannocystis exedens]PCC70697.1 hypothetical protein NAEX_03761 [Nannocystis exedens]SFE76192.1 hypothetical protein SAMN02745121_05418 [Nannocystis exedens]
MRAIPFFRPRSLVGVLAVVMICPATTAVTAAPDATPTDALIVGADWCAPLVARVREAAAERGHPVAVGSSVPALSDSGERGDPVRVEHLDLVVEIDVPPPRTSAIGQSMKTQAMVCGKAAVTCTLAATGFAPAVVACYGESVLCAGAVVCAVASCLD